MAATTETVIEDIHDPVVNTTETAEIEPQANPIGSFDWALTQLEAGKKIALPWYAEGVFYDELTDETVFGETERTTTEWLIVE